MLNWILDVIVLWAVLSCISGLFFGQMIAFGMRSNSRDIADERLKVRLVQHIREEEDVKEHIREQAVQSRFSWITTLFRLEQKNLD